MSQGEIIRPTEWSHLGDHDRRIRALEAASPADAADVVDSIAKYGDTPLTGDVTLSGGTGMSTDQVGQNIEFNNEGVLSVEADGSGALTGEITLSSGAGIATTTAGQDVEIASTLEVDDADVSVQPTVELAVGVGLQVGSPGGGVAALSARAVPYVAATRSGLTVPATGSSLIVDFKGGGSPGFTNDVAAETDYRTDLGAAFTNNTTWVGDNFRGSVGTATSAFRINRGRGGLYLVQLVVLMRVSGASGKLHVLLTTPGTVVHGSGSDTYAPFTTNVWLEHNISFLALIDGGNTNADIDFAVAMAQDTATASGADTTVTLSVFRLSPT